MQELIIIAIMILIIALPLCITLFLRKRYPGKILIGVLLAFFFDPVGQWYLENSILYFLGLFLFFTLVKYFTMNNLVAWISNMFLSALIMYYRFSKIKSAD